MPNKKDDVEFTRIPNYPGKKLYDHGVWRLYWHSMDKRFHITFFICLVGKFFIGERHWPKATWCKPEDTITTDTDCQLAREQLRLKFDRGGKKFLNDENEFNTFRNRDCVKWPDDCYKNPPGCYLDNEWGQNYQTPFNEKTDLSKMKPQTFLQMRSICKRGRYLIYYSIRILRCVKININV